MSMCGNGELKRLSGARRWCVILAAAVCVVLICALSQGTALAYSGSTYTWIIQNPVPQGTYCYATTAASTSAYWSVGKHGTILFWNGTTMTSQPSGTVNDLFAVDSSSATSAFAVGQNKTILYYNGTSWSSQTAPTPSGGYSYDLYGVYTTAANSAWAVGGQDGFHNAIILHLDATGWHVEAEYSTGCFQCVYGTSASAVWVAGQNTTGGRTVFWNGSTWALKDITRAPISISAYSTLNVWIVCWDGTVARSADGGQNYTPISNLTTDWPVSVCAYNATNVWVVGWNGTIRFTSNPTASPPTWTTGTTGDSFTGDLCAVFAVGTGATGACVAGDGRVYTGRTAFTSRSTNIFSTYAANGVSCYDANNIWACGGHGYVARSTNGGVSWATQNVSRTNNLDGICAQDSTHVWTTDTAGWINYWNGSAWTAVQDSAKLELFDVDGGNSSVAWACGGSATKTVITKTANGGTSWTDQVNANGNCLYGVSAVDSNNCWVVGKGGTIQNTTNGGTAWVTQTSNTTQDLQDVSALSSSTAWAVGNGGVIRYTSNGGTTWQTQNSGVTANLQSVSAVDATHVWAVGDSNTILFYNGTSWSTQTCPAGTTGLTHASACSSTSVWAVGNDASSYGYILFGDPPFIKSCSPNSGAPGDTVSLKITGGYTNFDQSSSQVVFSGSGVNVLPGTLSVVDAQTLTVVVSIDPGASPGPRDVNVVTNTEDPVALTGGFAVGPRIESVQPTRGVRGWTGDVSIIGEHTNFGSTSGATFGAGIAVNSVHVADAGHLTANITVSPSADPGARTVNVASGTETPVALDRGFTVPDPPMVISRSPASGPVGAEVTVSGDCFGSAMAAGSRVLFNGVPAGAYVRWSPTAITCRVPSGATTGPVTVATPDGASNRNKLFTVNSSQRPPVVSLVSPVSGPPCSAVTVTGENFAPRLVSPTVTIGGRPVMVVTWSDTRLVIIVPGGTPGGAVVVTTSAGVSNSDRYFTVRQLK